MRRRREEDFGDQPDQQRRRLLSQRNRRRRRPRPDVAESSRPSQARRLGLRRSQRQILREGGRLYGVGYFRERARSHHSGEVIFDVFVQGIPVLTLGRLRDNRDDLEFLFEGLLDFMGPYRFVNDQVYRLRMQATITGNTGISTDMLDYEAFTVNDFLEAIEALLNSIQSLNLNQFQIRIVWARMPDLAGGGGTGGDSIPAQFRCMDFETFCKKKRCCYWVNPRTTQNCFFDCMVLNELLLRGETDQLRNLSKRGDALEKHAAVYRQQCQDIIGLNEPVRHTHYKQLEARFGFRLYVIVFPQMRMIYNGNPDKEVDPGEKKMVVLCQPATLDYRGHYVLVNWKTMHALWNRRLFCFQCKKAYKDTRHTCSAKCVGCGSTACEGAHVDITTFEMQCNNTKCGRAVYNNACRQRHKCTSLGKFRRCMTCSQYYIPLPKYRLARGEESHRCYQTHCTNCKEWYASDQQHCCYHQPLTKEDMIEVTTRYVFYDYECVLGESEHEVAGIVAMTMDSDEVYEFHTHDAFIEWIFQDCHKGYTFIAHNSGRYDFHFVKREMLRRNIKSRDVCNGNTIFYSKETSLGIRFVDSFRFIPIGLRKFAKTFGLKDVSKTFFPYRFFTPENKFYKGPIPDRSYFDVDRMTEEEQATFETWYQSFEGKTVDLYRLCMNYCIDDVKVLKEGCKKFRSLFLELTDQEVDPFQYITIASVCMTIYRRFHLREKSIAILNERQATRSRLLFDREYGEQYEHHPCGYVDHDRHVVYMWRDCVDDGCLHCFNRLTMHPTQFRFMFDLHRQFEARRQQTADFFAPYKLVVVRECDFLATHSSDDLESVYPMDIRRAFYGGRTEPTKCRYIAKDGEVIRYRDFTSLYPTIQYGQCRGIADPEHTSRTFRYPIGHPETYTQVAPDQVLDYFGFADVDIVPPKDLYIPVLPARVDKKLMFHCRPQRGCWTTVELKKAVERGYVIERVHWVMHFSESSDTLFRNYVKTFLKVKQEAAGWKKLGAEEPDAQQAILEDYQQVMGITLDPDRISEEGNPGLYFIAKLCLNSLWGKFAQRENFDEQLDTFDDETFQEAIFDDTRKVKGVVMHDVNTRTITYEKRDKFRTGSKHVNIAIAAYTTAYARLRLYEALELTDRDTLYMDTDSVIYIDRGQLSVGPYLGDLTDELDEDDGIVSFVSTGPKCYAYTTRKGKTSCKIKGFSLNPATMTSLNGEVMHDLVTRRDETVKVKVQQPRFEINERHTIRTDPEFIKEFQFTFDKRQCCALEGDCLDTLPWT